MLIRVNPCLKKKFHCIFAQNYNNNQKQKHYESNYSE